MIRYGNTESSALNVQVRVVVAIMLREIQTRFGEFKAGYIWAILEPLVHTLSFAFIISFFSHSAPLGEHVHIFVATAVVPFFFWREVISRTESAVRANAALMYFPIVKPIDAIIARFILEFMTWTIISTIVVGVLILLGFADAPQSVLGCLTVLFILSIHGLGIGLLNYAISNYSHMWEKVFHVCLRPVYLASGIMFLPERLPTDAQYWLWFLPTAHLFDWIREYYFEGYTSTFLSKPYVLISALVMIGIGLLLERMQRRHFEG